MDIDEMGVFVWVRVRVFRRWDMRPRESDVMVGDGLEWL